MPTLCVANCCHVPTTLMAFTCRLEVDAALLSAAEPPQAWLDATLAAFTQAQEMEAAQRTTLEARGGGTHVALLGTQVVAVANCPCKSILHTFRRLCRTTLEARGGGTHAALLGTQATAVCTILIDKRPEDLVTQSVARGSGTDMALLSSNVGFLCLVSSHCLVWLSR